MSAALKLVRTTQQRDFTFEFRKALSAAAGKRIGDEMRAEILQRFDNRCHIRGDRSAPIRLPANWRRVR